LFLWAIFGYLVFMIFYKWCINYEGQDRYNDMYLKYYNISTVAAKKRDRINERYTGSPCSS